MINQGDCSTKPGWIRMSIHPTHTDSEIKFMVESIRQLAIHFPEWLKDYHMDLVHNTIIPNNPVAEEEMKAAVDEFFSLTSG